MAPPVPFDPVVYTKKIDGRSVERTAYSPADKVSLEFDGWQVRGDGREERVQAAGARLASRVAARAAGQSTAQPAGSDTAPDTAPDSAADSAGPGGEADAAEQPAAEQPAAEQPGKRPAGDRTREPAAKQ